MTEPAAPITGLAYDFRDPQFLSDPADYYRWLREEEPVHQHEASGAFLFSRYEDVLEATLDWTTFSSTSPVSKLQHMASMDPPDHDRLRSSVARWFTAARIGALEPMVREICRDLLEPLRSESTIEFVSAFASVFPSKVIHRILGVPDEFDRPLREAALAIGAAQDSDALAQGMRDLEDVTRGVLGAEASPDENGILQALQREPKSTRLEEAQIRGVCSNLVLAGTDTVTNLLGNGLVLLESHPDARRSLLDDRDQIPAAVEEMLRFESPVQSLARRTTRAHLRHGISIPAGAEIRLLWGSANRDDRVFDHPDRFDIDRIAPAGRRHLALGHGIHFCLGAGLARLEAKVAFEEFLSAWPDYTIDHVRLTRLASLWVRAWEAVQIDLGLISDRRPD